MDLVAGEPKRPGCVWRRRRDSTPVRCRSGSRWATPLEVVTRTVPQLLELGSRPIHPRLRHPRISGRGGRRSRSPPPADRRLPGGRGTAPCRARPGLRRGAGPRAQRGAAHGRQAGWRRRARGILSPTRPGAVGGAVRARADRSRCHVRRGRTAGRSGVRTPRRTWPGSPRRRPPVAVAARRRRGGPSRSPATSANPGRTACRRTVADGLGSRSRPANSARSRA